MMNIDKIAWIRLEEGRILSTRSRGKEVWYLPGGKREPGETDLETLDREIREELTVTVVTPVYFGTFTAQADGHADGVDIKMTCYTGDYLGELAASSEIEELRWLTYADRDRVAPVDKIIFDRLRADGKLSGG
jgi:8-oxo-dGTP pyrophosphatase MutT (NUDIX family)